MHEPLYIISKEGRVPGCSYDSNCNRHVRHAKCRTSNPYKGLCYTTSTTKFITSTTTSTTVPSTTTSIASAASTTYLTTGKTSSKTQTTSTTPATTAFFDQMDDEIRTNLTNMHNYRRSRLAQGLVHNGLRGGKLPQGANINELKYSMGLEHDAQRYANSCPSKPSSLRSRHFQGENIAWISSYDAHSIHVAASMAVKKFWHVIKSSSGINRKVRFTAQLEGRSSLLSFTQMAWASTTKFGCGVKLCQNNYVVVCRYSPRGNIVNQNIYNVGKTCSECSACTKAYLYKGLCTA